MKRFISQLVVIASVIFIAASCQQAPFITMTGPRSYTFTREGGTQSFSFACNREWSVSSTESWITVSPSKGSATDGETKVTITCSPNTTYDARSATITVKTEDLSESITITQDTGIGLIVSPKTFDLTNAEQTIEIEVQKNVQYTVAIDNTCADWIKQGGTKALTTDKITFTIAANKTYDNREGKITFKQLDGNLSETVVVRQNQTNGIFITTPTYDLSNAEHTLSVEVKANVEFEVTSQADWIKYVETKALTPSTVTLTIEANESYDNRTGTVLVKQTNGDLSGTITIKQHQTDGLFVTPDSFDLSNEEHAIELTVKQNVPYSVVIPDDAKTWVAVQGSNQTKALTEETVVLLIAKNTTYDDRETSVTIKQNDGSLAETVKIKQAYGEGLIVEKTEYEIKQKGETIEVNVKANVEYTVTPEVDWIHNVETKGLSGSTVVLTIDENPTYETRSSKVLINQIDGNLSVTISISQDKRIAVSSVILNKNTTAIIAGKSETLSASVYPVNATDDKTVSWSSTNEAVAKVENGIISAISSGTTVITAKAGDISADCSVRVQVVPLGAVNLETIAYGNDLKAYYVFWSNKNIGATKEEEYGNYYAWGVTEPNSINPYKWSKGGKVTKYCPLGFEDYWAGEGSPDGKTELDPEDDAAHVVLGGTWRIPKGYEFDALINQCSYSRVTKNGVKGTEFKSKVNSNSIFLPAAGYTHDGVTILEEGIYGLYWSSGVGWSGVEWACGLGTYPNQVSTMQTIRAQGFSIRAVSE